MAAAASNMVRELTVEDLPRLVPIGYAFFEEGKLEGKFNPAHFIKEWGSLLAAKAAVILAHEENGEIGAILGGMIFPNLLTGEVEGTEQYLYANPEFRGQGIGLRLLDEFESISKGRGALRVWMIHLVDLNDDAMVKLYERKGYRLKEKMFVKQL
jgi:GNAT superfamily N-acetyltransferase